MTVTLYAHIPDHVKLALKGLRDDLLSSNDISSEMMTAIQVLDPRVFFKIYLPTSENISRLYNFLLTNEQVKFRSPSNTEICDILSWLHMSHQPHDDPRIQYILKRLPFPEYVSAPIIQPCEATGIYFEYLKAQAYCMKGELFARKKIKRLSISFGSYVEHLECRSERSDAHSVKYVEVREFFKNLCRTEGSKDLAAKLIPLLQEQSNNRTMQNYHSSYLTKVITHLEKLFPEEMALRDVLTI